MTELFKKHRPKTLKKMVGNTNTVNTLTNMLKRGALPHTLLFSGPSGCGKTTLARILKTELDCHRMDFTELDCSAFRGIDTVREIMRNMKLAPTGGKVRIWLLDECHQMTKAAQNSALKMLEDTPAHVYFFLCTTDPLKLIPTIRSRCCDLPVRLLEEDDITKLVTRVARKEGIKLTSETLSLLAVLAEGSARVSLVMLDKIANLPEDQRDDAIRKTAAEQNAAIDLCRVLLKRDSWMAVQKILRTLKGDPEAIRYAVLGYARTALLRGRNPQAYVVICAFENNFYDSKQAGLMRACYEATFGE